MKLKKIGKKISYWFDCLMSKGPIAMSMLLLAVTMAIVGTIGVIAYFVADEGNLFYQLWNSLLYTMDAGNLAGVSTDNVVYLLLMFLLTLCGLFLTSVLIGVVTTGVESKLSDLRKGTSIVQENDHTVIIGFDNNVYAILRELIEANSNKKKECIVLLGEEPKEEMEDAIASHIPDTKTTRIICRSGRVHEMYALERCSIETCKSVIVNVAEDAETVKVLLALASYVKDKELRNQNLKFIASLQEQQYMEAAYIAGEGRAAIIHAKDAIARIISNTCRQHGLSQVLMELFDFDGDELYFESVAELEGKTFKEATLSFSNAVAIGLCSSDGEVRLNPPMDSVIGKGERVVLLEEDDGVYAYHPAKAGDATVICEGDSTRAKENSDLIVLGSNEKLPTILAEYAKYVQDGTEVVIVDDDLDEKKLGTYENLKLSICRETVTRNLLSEFLIEKRNNVLLLNDDSQDFETSDSQTLLRLILLRDIADETNRQISITTEMRSVDNKRLASQARVDDFVIGTDFASLMMAQVSENPELMPLIDDLLDEEGSELYMKPVADYVKTGVEVDSYTLTESAARRGEVYLGYRHIGAKKTGVVINPQKDEKIVFGEKDLIVVIAED